ncbi:MAG TPA: hypothetical protein PLG87_11920 [Treponemataceae bacterium]|nr:hypothetical protein [Treponemataceae bacterium]
MEEKKRFFCGNGKRKFSVIAIIGMVIGGLALAVLFAFLFGWVVMLLWNWLMPDIFGLPHISYWQGWGLVLLSHILIKGGWGSSGSSDKKKKKEDEDEDSDNPWHVIKSEIKKEIWKEMNKDASFGEENADTEKPDEGKDKTGDNKGIDE